MGKKFLDGFAESSPEWDDTWSDADKKSFRSKELKKFIAVLFLRNSDYSTYNKLLVDYRKNFANKLNLYPESLEDMVDVMRQVIPKKKKSDKNHNNNGNGNNKGDQDKGQNLESSNTQTTKGGQSDDACYACGDKTCRL